MARRATSDAMDGLHGTMARLLTDELVRAAAAASAPRRIKVKNDKGEEHDAPNPEYAALNPQLLDKVLKFLKDNGIDSPEKNAAVAGLAAALDDLDLDYTPARMHS